MDKLLKDWAFSTPTAPCTYVAIAVAAQLVLRVLMSALAAQEYSHTSDRTFWDMFKESLCGKFSDFKHQDKSDYWYNFWLGLLEILSYPILMVTGSWTIIGAWIGFKAVAQWKAWNENRAPFQRFLIGNALVVLVSFLVMTRFVKDTSLPLY